ncbi:uncharacterized protein [Dermacentor andersoni]|uniref:uncharacterized protein isoform X3 n=1 Tax=Dermacentor andersoni TaxID=34620 RepID=UPI002415DA2A|nr:uncharacterized protein LOC126534066 isoform X3 [Dermacentor andersoni]
MFASLPDREFVHTPEPIWTYNTTSYVMLPCRVDVMYNLTDPFILFHRSYFSGITKYRILRCGTAHVHERKRKLWNRYGQTLVWRFSDETDLREPKSMLDKQSCEHCGRGYNIVTIRRIISTHGMTSGLKTLPLNSVLILIVWYVSMILGSKDSFFTCQTAKG